MKIIKIALISVLSLLLLAAMVIYFFFRSTIPAWDGVLTDCPIASEATIERGPHGVPSIKAGSAGDLFFAIGFVHAQDRLFQMDLQRRAAAGRLAEVLGARELGRDVWQRGLQTEAGNERSLRALKPEVKAALEHYCRGVNHFLASQSLPPEFHLLGYEPEEWQIRDVLGVMKFLEGELAYSGGELNYANLLSSMTPRQAWKWLAAPRPDFTAGGDSWTRMLAAPELAHAFESESRMMQQDEPGSAWAASRGKTRSGLPILANEFSWAPQLPSLFYQVSGRTPALEISGNTLPGIPFIFSGRNWHIGWGIYAADSDTIDFFLLERKAGNKDLYLCGDGWQRLEKRAGVVRCRNGRDVVLDLAVSRFGPALEAGGSLLAVRSLVQHRSSALEALYRLNTARNWREFTAACGLFTAPVLRLVFADRKGNIGACQTGLVPLRGRGDGLLPVRARALSDTWQGFAGHSSEKLISGPARGWLSAAELEALGRPEPLFFTFGRNPGFRSQRLAALLSAAGRIEPESAARIQNDAHVEGAGALIDLIQGLPLASPEARSVRDALAAWDRQAADGEGPAFYYTFERLLADALFSRVFRGSAASQVPDRWIHAALADPGFLKRDELASVVDKALAGTYEAYHERTRRQDDGWRWENLHTATFGHPLGAVLPLRPLFERGAYSARGGRQCLGSSDFVPGSGFHATRLPAYRMILDLADFSESLMAYPGGQSGHPLSTAFDDQLAPYLSQRYLKMEGRGHRTFLLRLLPMAPFRER